MAFAEQRRTVKPILLRETQAVRGIRPNSFDVAHDLFLVRLWD